jgi:hypothetical protein
MEPQEIFEFIIKADEKLKYAHEDNAGLRRQQARDLLVQARAAATEIGNDALVQQADTRLADLDGPGDQRGDQRGDQPGDQPGDQKEPAG